MYIHVKEEYKMNDLSQTQLFFTTTFILGTIAFVLMALGAFLGFAHARTVTRNNTPSQLHWVVIGFIALWYGIVMSLVAADAISLNLVAISAIIPVVVGFILSFTDPVKEYLRETKTHWLVLLQLYRVVGIIFIFPYLSEGLVVREFALNAGIGDVLTGLLAVPVALALANNHGFKRTLLYGWTAFGVLDLVLAMGSAAFFGFATDDTAGFPITLLPIFLGPPLSILLHALTVRSFQLAEKQNVASVQEAKVVQTSR